MMEIECTPLCCNLGSINCGNRQHSTKIYGSYIKNVDSTIGLGLFASENIPQDGNIGEYMGETLSYKKFNDRDAPRAEKNLYCKYVYKISKDMYIDAEYFGGKTRFVNHSCFPNAVAEQMSVDGETRIFMRALAPISINEEILVSYDTKNLPFKCTGSCCQNKV